MDDPANIMQDVWKSMDMTIAEAATQEPEAEVSETPKKEDVSETIDLAPKLDSVEKAGELEKPSPAENVGFPEVHEALQVPEHKIPEGSAVYRGPDTEEEPQASPKPRKRRALAVPGNLGGVNMDKVNDYVGKQEWSDSTRAVSGGILRRFWYLRSQGRSTQQAYEEMCIGISYEPYVHSRIVRFLRAIGEECSIDRNCKPDKPKRAGFTD